jgi:ribosomal silencing factor RsfS
VAEIIFSKFVEDYVGKGGANEDQMSWIPRIAENRWKGQNQQMKRAQIESDDNKKWTTLQNGDLVLLLFETDVNQSLKLEPHWEGPCKLGGISYHGKSGRLFGITPRQLVKVRESGAREKCHLNDLKLFLPISGCKNAEYVDLIDNDFPDITMGVLI